MSKLPCNVIEDLLPLYVDHICHERTMIMVEEHLTSCESCHQLYENMQTKLPEILVPEDQQQAKEDAKMIKAIKHEITFRQIVIIGIAILLIILAWAIPEYYPPANAALQNIPVFDSRIPAGDIKVTQLYELKDGSIYYTLESDKKFTRFTPSEIIVPKSKWEKSYDNGWNEITLSTYWTDKLSADDSACHEISLTTTLVNDVNTKKASYRHESTAIYYVGKKDKRLLIWEKGQEIKPAPKAIEEKVEKERQSIDEIP